MADLSESIVGVIDLLDGVVVRAVAGDRDRYQPWHSPLADSSDPLAVARVFRRHYNIMRLYIADLNALRGGAASYNIVRQIVADGFHVTLDAGPRDAGQISAALETGVESVVLPLETLPHRSKLAAWSRKFDPDRLAFGLDLAAGVPLAESRVWDLPQWDENSPQHIARDVVALGIKKLIVLDLRAVGRQAGPTTKQLCRDIRRSLPSATVWTGGGIRDAEDIVQLRTAGADRVLVATALHDRSLR